MDTTDTAHTDRPRSIAFIGLGIMGGPMAANLVQAEHKVTGHNRSRAAVDRLVSARGHGAETVAEAVTDADVVITMLPADAEVTEVVLGEGGVLAHARPGTLLIDMSTVSPHTAATLAEAGRDRGVRVLDPVRRRGPSRDPHQDRPRHVRAAGRAARRCRRGGDRD